jgi:GMP synthase (glutamine-hydrolysing)
MRTWPPLATSGIRQTRSSLEGVTTLVVQNVPSAPIGRLGEWLVAAGLNLDVRDWPGLPDDLSGHDGLVVLGGGTVGDEPPQLRELLAAALADERPTLAICYGAQLLATVLGGRVGLNPEGPEYGAQLIAKRANAATDPMFREMPITPDVIQWHRDAVLDLPPSAVLLASSPVCDVQAFRAGRVAWGIQFHIETTPDIVRRWAASDAAVLENYDVDAMLERADAVHADIAEVWRPFAERFATIVRDPSSVPATRPPRMATAEPITDPAAIRAALAAEMRAARPQ